MTNTTKIQPGVEVTITDGKHKGATGHITNVGDFRGVVDNPEHRNHGRVYYDVTIPTDDAMSGYQQRNMVFADDLQVNEEAEKPQTATPNTPAGTRVTVTTGTYAGRTGTVLDHNHGTVDNPAHPNHGRAYLMLALDKTGSDFHNPWTRQFVEDLQVNDAEQRTISAAGYGVFNDEGCAEVFDSREEAEERADEYKAEGLAEDDDQDEESESTGTKSLHELFGSKLDDSEPVHSHHVACGESGGVQTAWDSRLVTCEDCLRIVHPERYETAAIDATRDHRNT